MLIKAWKTELFLIEPRESNGDGGQVFSIYLRDSLGAYQYISKIVSKSSKKAIEEKAEYFRNELKWKTVL